VLSHCTDSDLEPQYESEPAEEYEDGSSAGVNREPLSVMQELGISSFRPHQQEALDLITQAVNLSQQERRLTTAAIVVPTSSGKDLLPLALSKFTGGVSIMFVPYT
jgi:ATP-dependent helicase YprA (DUF1998 family)